MSGADASDNRPRCRLCLSGHTGPRHDAEAPKVKPLLSNNSAEWLGDAAEPDCRDPEPGQ